MKIFLLIIACAAGGWYWLVGSRQISESEVQSFYQQEQQWFADQKTKEMCAALDEKYIQRSTQVSSAGRQVEELDKAKACQAMEAIDSLRAKFGNRVGVEITENLGKIEIGSDKKTARVHVSSVFTMGTAEVKFMKVSGEMDETFTKRNGKLLRLSAEGTSFVE